MSPNFPHDGPNEEDITSLVANGDWQTLLSQHHRNKYLPWIWPSLEDLTFLVKEIKTLGVDRIVSIGCGSGLLEWLITKATDFPVKGVEVDRSWWTSKHCSTFLPLEYATDFVLGYKAADKTDALLFCYFNNELAFLDYLLKYDGPCLIVIGPGEDRGTHTLPTPFLLPTPADQQWKLHSLRELNSGKDFIGIFTRK